MPIVDGLTSTEMIRKVETSPEHQGHSTLAKSNGRIPIFAVSASLLEHEKQKYVDAGFDGWILKPIDFKRLNTLLSGIGDDEIRRSCLYEPGEWERGGWLTEREALPATAPPTEEDTTPTGKNENRDSLAAAGVQVVDKAAEHFEQSSVEHQTTSTTSTTSAEPSA
jgi:CheY-like chemotaxis protein